MENEPQDPQQQHASSDWIIGICFTSLGTVADCASKLAIRKSWLMQHTAWQSPLPPSLSSEEQDGVFRTTALSSIPEESERSCSSASVSSDSQVVTTTVEQQQQHGPQHEPNASSSTSLASWWHTLQSQPPHVRRRLYAAYAVRVAGMAGMTILDPIFSVLALSYASPSLLAPFAALTPVWVVLLSRPLIGERPTRRQVGAALLIVMGASLVGIFGDHTNPDDATVDDVRRSYAQAPWLWAYLAGLVLWMAWLFWGMAWQTRSAPLKRFCWGVAGGSVTGLQNFIKDSMTVIQAVQQQQKQQQQKEQPQQSTTTPSSLSDYPWFLAILLPAAGAAAFGGLLLLTACMKRYNAAYSSAMFVASYILSASIMSAVHYATFSHLEALINTLLYPCGLLVVMGGIGVLVQEQHRIEHDEANMSGQSVESDASRLQPYQPVVAVADEEENEEADDYWQSNTSNASLEMKNRGRHMGKFA